MTESSLVFTLFGATVALAILFGIYQWWRATKARREHHPSVAEKRPPVRPQTRIDGNAAPVSQLPRALS